MFKDGFVLLDKPEGISSNQLNYKVKRVFHTSKVGHLGTLDPFATGLIVIGVNQGTKILPLLNSDKKEYIAKIQFSKTTDTLDNTSNNFSYDNSYSKSKILENIDILKKYNNYKYFQTPPKFSSKSVNGIRAYDYARNGIDIKLQPKEITIHSLAILENNIKLDDTILIKVSVSSGTYIRQLALDIAKDFNTLAYLTYLRRTKVGDFLIDQANKIENLTEADLYYAKDIQIENITKYFLNEDEFNKIKYGNPYKMNFIGEKVLFFYENNLLYYSEYDYHEKIYKMKRGFNIEYYKNRF